MTIVDTEAYSQEAAAGLDDILSEDFVLHPPNSKTG
jgi:hypothetical protein